MTAKATEILKQNMTDGTGTTANIDCPAAGKTGTTDEFTDAWFVGFTPRLSTAVWVGYPNDRTQMLGLYHGANVAGATFPSEIWHTYMEAAKGKFCGDFPPPKTPFTLAAVLRQATPPAAARATRPRAATRTPDDAPCADARARGRHARGHRRRRSPATATATATDGTGTATATTGSTPTPTRRRPQPPARRRTAATHGGTQAPG